MFLKNNKLKGYILPKSVYRREAFSDKVQCGRSRIVHCYLTLSAPTTLCYVITVRLKIIVTIITSKPMPEQGQGL
jgi:hypothetical protein